MNKLGLKYKDPEQFTRLTMMWNLHNERLPFKEFDTRWNNEASDLCTILNNQP